ncbi:MAG: hypothetical protein AB7H97_01815 [Pseudobdellovibrionaceae bacterium]
MPENLEAGGGGGNGQGYDGKIYVHFTNVVCDDGTKVDSSIIFHGDQAYLNRDKCADIAETKVDVTPLSSTTLLYNDRIFSERLAMLFDLDTATNGQSLASVSGFDVVADSLVDRGFSIAKYESSGQLAWAKSTTGISKTLRSRFLPDGSVIVVSQSLANQSSPVVVWVAKLDSNGNLLWSKGIENNPRVSTANFEFTEMGVSSGGEVVVGGFVRTPNQSPVAAYLKLDASGNLIYAKKVGLAGSSAISGIAFSPTNELYATGVIYGSSNPPPFLLKIDGSGQATAAVTYSSFDNNVSGLKLFFSSTGVLHASGAGLSTDTQTSLLSYNYRILKLNPDGTIISSHKIGNGDLPLGSLAQSSDGGFYGSLQTTLFHLSEKLVVDQAVERSAIDGFEALKVTGAGSGGYYLQLRRPASLAPYFTDLLAKVESGSELMSCPQCTPVTIAATIEANPSTVAGPTVLDETGLLVQDQSLSPFVDSQDYLSIINQTVP